MNCIEFDLAADAADLELERAVHKEAVQRGLVSPGKLLPRRACTLVAKITGLGRAGHVAAGFGMPVDETEGKRWVGWVRWWIQNKGAGVRIHAGPNGGLSSRSRRWWILQISTARKFGFVPQRLMAAAAVAVAEAKRLGLTLPESRELMDDFLINSCRGKAKRTRRNVRRFWLWRCSVGKSPMPTSGHRQGSQSRACAKVGSVVVVRGACEVMVAPVGLDEPAGLEWFAGLMMTQGGAYWHLCWLGALAIKASRQYQPCRHPMHARESALTQPRSWFLTESERVVTKLNL